MSHGWHKNFDEGKLGLKKEGEINGSAEHNGSWIRGSGKYLLMKTHFSPKHVIVII